MLKSFSVGSKVKIKLGRVYWRERGGWNFVNKDKVIDR